MDELTSVCFGLTCKKLYQMHWALHEKVSLYHHATAPPPSFLAYLTWGEILGYLLTKGEAGERGNGCAGLGRTYDDDSGCFKLDIKVLAKARAKGRKLLRRRG